MDKRERKRVLHYYQGGLRVANRMLRQAEAADALYDVALVYSDDVEERNGRAYEQFRITFVEAARPRPGMSPLWKLPRFIWRVGRLLRTLLRQDADLFHPHQQSSVLVTLLWTVFSRAPVVFDPHDMNIHAKDRRGWVARIQRWLERRVVRRSRGILVVSQGMRDFYAKTYPDTPVYLLPNLPAREVADATMITDAEESDGSHAGLIKRERLPVGAVRAIGEADNVTLDVFGFGPDSYEAEVRQFVETQGYRNIRMRGSYSEQDIVPRLRDFDYFILPYWIQNENVSICMPNKLYQALCAGLPLIASDMAEIGRLIRENDVGHVFPNGDYAGLSSVLAELDRGGDAFPRQRACVRKLAREMLNYDRYADTLFQAYATALGSRDPAGTDVNGRTGGRD